MITQLIFGLNKELRILVLAPSNAAVDIIARRLLDVRDRMHATKGEFEKSVESTVDIILTQKIHLAH